jgi:hypothetical protein
VSRYDFRKPGHSLDTGAFTQLVWRETTAMGCAARLCKDGIQGTSFKEGSIVVCRWVGVSVTAVGRFVVFFVVGECGTQVDGGSQGTSFKEESIVVCRWVGCGCTGGGMWWASGCVVVRRWGFLGVRTRGIRRGVQVGGALWCAGGGIVVCGWVMRGWEQSSSQVNAL